MENSDLRFKKFTKGAAGTNQRERERGEGNEPPESDAVCCRTAVKCWILLSCVYAAGA